MLTTLPSIMSKRCERVKCSQLIILLLICISYSGVCQGTYVASFHLRSSSIDSSFYQKPKRFSYITQLPPTLANTGKEIFNKKSITTLSLIAASTVILLPIDQQINNSINQFSGFIKLDPERKYKTIIGFNLGKTEVKAYEAPQNINTFFYSVGEGSTSLFICAGLYLHGVIRKDNKSLQVSSQLMQSLLSVGFATQFIKRISGRESPFVATLDGGKWHPFTNPVTYQSKVPSYDAFPSGHLATMMATTTVLTINYPEKKWIKPVGYGLMTLVSLAMLNNEVHWTSDYPLALGVGYIFGKVSVNLNRWVKGGK